MSGYTTADHESVHAISLASLLGNSIIMQSDPQDYMKAFGRLSPGWDPY